MNTAPTQTVPILNATLYFNTTNLNLTAYNQSTADADNDGIKNIFNWKLNGTSLAVLNMLFEGGSNNTFTVDYSGFGNNGSVTNAAWNASGGYDDGGAYNFNGTTDYIIIPVSNSLNMSTNDFSISAWIKPKSISPNGDIIYADPSHTWCTRGFSFFVRNGSYNGLTLRTSKNDGCDSPTRLEDVSPSSDYTNTLLNGRWHFVAAVVNRNSTSYIYIDGLQVGSYANNISWANQSISNTAVQVIGADSGGSNNFNGSIDNLIVWNRSLSSQQILALYHNRTNLIA